MGGGLARSSSTENEVSLDRKKGWGSSQSGEMGFNEAIAIASRNIRHMAAHCITLYRYYSSRLRRFFWARAQSQSSEPDDDDDTLVIVILSFLMRVGITVPSA